MARKAKDEGAVIEVNGKKLRNVNGVYVPEDLEPGLFDDAISADSADMMEPALQGVLAELGERDEQAKVTVSRIINENGVRKDAYLYECHPSEFTMRELQECYGAGDYRVRVYGQQAGSNYKVVHANKRLTIGASQHQARTGEKPGATVTQAPAATSDIGKAVADALAPVLQAQAQLLQQMMHGGTSRKDALAEMQIMAQILKPAESQQNANDPAKMVNLVRGIMEIVGPRDKESVQEVDEKSGPYAVLLQAIRTFGDFMQQRQGAVPGGEVRALPGAETLVQSDASAAGSVAINSAPQQSSEDAMASFALKMQLGVLLNAALANSDTETYSQLIYEQAPDEAIAILESPQWWEKLVEIEPGFAPHKAWCEKVRNEVLADLKADAAPENDVQAPAGAPKPPATAG